MKRTLLDDIIQIYFTIPRDTKPKNKLICDMIENLIKSIRKFY